MLNRPVLLGIESIPVSPVQDSFLQYGAIGAVALIFIAVAFRLFNQLQAAYKAEMERIDAAHNAAIQRADSAYGNEKTRADRLESELRELNKLINDKLAGELVRASDAVREAFETMHERRRQ